MSMITVDLKPAHKRALQSILTEAKAWRGNLDWNDEEELAEFDKMIVKAEEALVLLEVIKPTKATVEATS